MSLSDLLHSVCHSLGPSMLQKQSLLKASTVLPDTPGEFIEGIIDNPYSPGFLVAWITSGCLYCDNTFMSSWSPNSCGRKEGAWHQWCLWSAEGIGSPSKHLWLMPIHREGRKGMKRRWLSSGWAEPDTEEDKCGPKGHPQPIRPFLAGLLCCFSGEHPARDQLSQPHFPEEDTDPQRQKQACPSHSGSRQQGWDEPTSYRWPP